MPDVLLAASATPIDSQPLPVTGSSLDVLIIDADELSSMRLEALSESCGHGAFSVTSVDQARQALTAVHFPILIVDALLGDGSGIDLCREYRARYPKNAVYIVMLSMLETASDIEMEIAAGADAYIGKHSSDEKLIERLRLAASAMGLTAKSSS
ncbi:MAG: response regulator [Steroidobacteraceae bacterium]